MPFQKILTSLESVWVPDWMASEEAIDVPHLINNEEAERHADDSASETEAVIQTAEAWCRSGEWNGDGGGDEHHSSNGAETEYEQIENR